MEATVNLITKLQPHFLSIWTFQGWNLAYNVSVEWDAPEDKYEWIKKGIKFLQDGVSKNRKSPDLIWDTAWTYYHKLGFADESIILRRLFRDDDDEAFKPTRPDRRHQVVDNDNFQLAHGWFSRPSRWSTRGEQRVADGRRGEPRLRRRPAQRKGRPGDLAFRSMPAHAQTRYAVGLEKMSMVGIPATFGEVAKNEWGRRSTSGSSSASYEFAPRTTTPEHAARSGSTTSTDPSGYASSQRQRQQYWTNRWADQMNYPYWKDRCAAEMSHEGVAGPPALLRGDPRPTRRPTSRRPSQKYRDGLESGTTCSSGHRTTATTS